jgi:hypothetical protein
MNKKAKLSIPNRILCYCSGADWMKMQKLKEKNKSHSQRFYNTLGWFVVLVTLLAVAEGAYAGTHFTDNEVAIGCVATMWGAFVFNVERSIMIALLKTYKSQFSFKYVLTRALFSLGVAFIMIPLALLFFFKGAIDQNIAQEKNQLKTEKRLSQADIEGSYDSKAQVVVQEQGRLMQNTPKVLIELRKNVTGAEVRRDSLKKEGISFYKKRRWIESKDSITIADKQRIAWLKRQSRQVSGELKTVESNLTNLNSSLEEQEKAHNEYMTERAQQLKEQLVIINVQKKDVIQQNDKDRQRLFTAIDNNDKLSRKFLELGKLFHPAHTDFWKNIIMAIFIAVGWIAIQIFPVAVKALNRQTNYDRMKEVEETMSATKHKIKMEAIEEMGKDDDLKGFVENQVKNEIQNENFLDAMDTLKDLLDTQLTETQNKNLSAMNFFEEMDNALKKIKNKKVTNEDEKKIQERHLQTYWSMFDRLCSQFESQFRGNSRMDDEQRQEKKNGFKHDNPNYAKEILPS